MHFCSTRDLWTKARENISRGFLFHSCIGGKKQKKILWYEPRLKSLSYPRPLPGQMRSESGFTFFIGHLQCCGWERLFKFGSCFAQTWTYLLIPTSHYLPMVCTLSSGQTACGTTNFVRIWSRSPFTFFYFQGIWKGVHAPCECHKCMAEMSGLPLSATFGQRSKLISHNLSSLQLMTRVLHLKEKKAQNRKKFPRKFAKTTKFANTGGHCFCMKCVVSFCFLG